MELEKIRTSATHPEVHRTYESECEQRQEAEVSEDDG